MTRQNMVSQQSDSSAQKIIEQSLFIVDKVQLNSPLALPMVPSGTEEQPLRRWWWLTGVDKIKANCIYVGFPLPKPQMQMTAFEYSQIHHLKLSAA